ncbi:hypothetical protein [Nocardia paucivorans]|uniref:hypothetical protein n=1 Tax=Nocardia paucivorans TaxID=114259 RepID=UPI0002ED484F|nr:hypothetical protein [Nocardia paucivorans]
MGIGKTYVESGTDVAPDGRRHGVRTAIIAIALGCAVVASTTMGTVPAGATPDGDVVANLACGWSPRIGADTINFAFPDTFANYWTTFLPAIPGASLTIHGAFPHARYMSYTAYSERDVVGSLNDQAIAADSGSVNPFGDGADREGSARGYTVRVVRSAPPPNPEVNTLYVGDITGNVPVAYRIYRPDAGFDATGGAGLPRLSVNLPDGTHRDLPECIAPTASHDPHAPHSSGQVMRSSGRKTPPHAPDWQPFAGGGLYSNPDNKYLATLLEPGRVAVIQARMPSTPATYHKQPVMGSGQVRYWSLCSNNPASTAVTACVVDDETTLDSDGGYTIVASSSGDRPANATGECGIGWLPTDSGSDLLIMRNMLPSGDFRHSIQNADPADPESSMGSYYPRVRYVSKADVEAVGCPAR